MVQLVDDQKPGILHRYFNESTRTNLGRMAAGAHGPPKLGPAALHDKLDLALVDAIWSPRGITTSASAKEPKGNV